jgi:hypothetical protein
MPDNQMETFPDRCVAIALFDLLRGRDPSKPWPLLSILAFVVEMRNQLQLHEDGQGQHLTFPASTWVQLLPLQLQ